MSERYSARDLCKELNYADWRNFDGLVQRAAEIIDSGLAKGSIKSTTTSVPIGSGALRSVPDYTIDLDAKRLITVLAAQYKPEETLVCARADARLSWDSAFDGSDAHLLTAASQSAEPVALTVPEGFALVPQQPTEAMVNAAIVRRDDWRDIHAGRKSYPYAATCETYRAMIKAAPPAATGAHGLTVADKKRIAQDVQVTCSLIPGATHYNAAEMAIDAILAQSAPAATAPSASPADAEEDAYVIDRLGKLLAEVAIALKGPDLARHRHSYHDLPQVAQTMALELDLYRTLYGEQAPADAGASPAALTDEQARIAELERAVQFWKERAEYRELNRKLAASPAAPTGAEAVGFTDAEFHEMWKLHTTVSYRDGKAAPYDLLRAVWRQTLERNAIAAQPPAAAEADKRETRDE